MSIWDALTGRKSAQHHNNGAPAPAPPTAPGLHEPASPALASAGADATVTTTLAQPTSPVYTSPAPPQPPATGGAEAFLQSSAFADPTQLHPLAGLNRETLEYITMEDSTLSNLPGSQSVLPSRGFTDDLCYGTGVSYLAALSLGGAWGLQEGLRRSAGQPPKLRLNSVLNAVTRRGPFLGNSAGVVAIVYNCINSYLGYVRGRHDAANSVLAGALSGVVFKSTRGLRPMMISGGIVASIAAAWTVARRTFFPVESSE